MNEQTTKLLQQLADKLDTTADQLWQVLIEQASYHSIILSINFIAVLITGYILYRIHLKLMSKIQTGEFSETYYDKYRETVGFPMVIGFTAWVVWFVISITTVGDIFTGFVHPEYWALEEILQIMK